MYIKRAANGVAFKDIKVGRVSDNVQLVIITKYPTV